MMKLVKQKKIKILSRRIGIEVVIMKKPCKQEVIGMRMYQFKVSVLNSLHFISNSYFNVKKN